MGGNFRAVLAIAGQNCQACRVESKEWLVFCSDWVQQSLVQSIWNDVEVGHVKSWSRTWLTEQQEETDRRIAAGRQRLKALVAAVGADGC